MARKNVVRKTYDFSTQITGENMVNVVKITMKKWAEKYRKGLVLYRKLGYTKNSSKEHMANCEPT